jgi:hypothetical protein
MGIKSALRLDNHYWSLLAKAMAASKINLDIAQSGPVYLLLE